MTIDILICSLNKGIVRLGDVLLPQQDGVRYVVSYQYTDERYLDLIPEVLKTRGDVSLYTIPGQGLSANRNSAMEKATADLILFADDDARFTDQTIPTILQTFDEHPDLDVAFFQCSTYTGKPLKPYPAHSMHITSLPETYSISTIEMVAKRASLQNRIRFDERFGLGTKFLTCGEEDIWMVDALRLKLKMQYFPLKIVETSTLLKRSLLFVDPGVQRSKGAFLYYTQGWRAWWTIFAFAFKSTRQGYCHFFPMLRHLAEGIRYMR